ncbi:uncharacterized protein lrif1 [Phyllopteryx taeniolatus]|uniref:uncharacterized protein lrif1 n=1 Tax=Phyllopteryx taeniolatus TaxID=161469 RepID=UPI002AD3B8F1|nr:uncharacterized protein lrif1 [Phyllopteryx taeniolatus]
MYSAPREDNAAQSGTGVFYQALPALGTDGKNIMVLIPVEMVNGKCVQSQINKPKTQDAVPLNVVSAPVPFGIKTALTSLATQQTTGNQVSLVNALPCQLGVAGQGHELGISLNKYPLRTVKPQTFLGAPQNQVQTVTTSEVASGINKQSFMSSTDCFSSSDSTSVANVSSKTTVCQSNVSTCLSELERFCSASPMTSLPLRSPKSHLKLIPKVSQRPNSPMKWLIEEVYSESAVDLPNSPLIQSKTFKTVESSKTFGVFEKVMPVSLSGLTSSETHNQQASVMCDGRVFLAAKNDTLSSTVGSREKRCHLKNSAVLSSSSLLQDSRIITPKEPNEVIDLCSDDNPDDLCEIIPDDMPTGSSLDEDNVIFVSYIPPKPEYVPMQSLVGKTLEIDTNQTSTKTMHNVTECERTSLNCSNTVHDQLTCESMDGCSVDKSQEPEHSMMASTAPNDDSDSVMSSQHNTQKQQLDRIEVSLGMESLSHPSASGLNSRESTDKVKSSSTASPVYRSSDHLLRQIFGVTSDVRICLQRINPGSAGTGLKESVPTEDIQETTNLLKERELFMQYSYNPQDPHRSSSPVNVKRAKLSDVQNLSGETVTTSPLAGIMVGYVEPIDDDIASIDENYTPDSQDSAGRSLNSARPNTSRMGRPRKRTMCPCCVPGTLGLTRKSRTRAVESERLTWTRDHTSKRGGR